jgi:hypothetical protein
MCKQSVVYYESTKRELQIKPMYECRCDERLQTKTKRFTRLSYTGLAFASSIHNKLHWVGRGTGTPKLPKDKDEVNKLGHPIDKNFVINYQ